MTTQKLEKPILEVYTDGACRGNQFQNNIGAWSYFITDGKRCRGSYDKAINTTNNIMELTAVLKALISIKVEARATYHIKLYSDSTYVVKGATEWWPGWVKKGWKNIANRELWEQVIDILKKFPSIEVLHIAGHSGNTFNELADELCNVVMDDAEGKPFKPCKAAELVKFKPTSST